MSAPTLQAERRPGPADPDLRLGRLLSELAPRPDRQASRADDVTPRVLLVDDEAGVRGELAALLVEEGIAVVGEAADGAAGVALALRLRPNVVLMDLRMPVLAGIEATSRVREALPRTQVILLSAYDDVGLQQAAREAGACAYLVKGGEVDEVLDAIEAAASLAHHPDAAEERP